MAERRAGNLGGVESTPPATAPGPPPPPPPLAGAPVHAPRPARPRRTPRAGAWALRVTLTLLALACVGQPLSIGRYLDGDYDAVGLHSGNAVLLVLLATAAGVAALVWWLGGGHPVPLVLLVVLWFALGFQMGMGYTRNLTIHIPLGVGIVAATLALAGWSWTGRVFRRAR